MAATGTATVQFSLDRFEIVAAAPGIALLRVAGRWSCARGAITLGTPELVVDDGTGVQRVELLPGPDRVVPAAGPGGVPWRGGFQLTPEAAEDPSTSFMLEAGDGVVVELPRPTVRDEKPAPGRRMAGEGETGLRGLLDEQSRRRIEAERAAEQAEDRARELEAELETERDDRREAESTLEAARAEHEERAERQRTAETRCAAAVEARQVAEARAADAERALEEARLATAGSSS